jgi:hypothetical protein
MQVAPPVEQSLLADSARILGAGAASTESSLSAWSLAKSPRPCRPPTFGESRGKGLFDLAVPAAKPPLPDASGVVAINGGSDAEGPGGKGMATSGL